MENATLRMLLSMMSARRNKYEPIHSVKRRKIFSVAFSRLDYLLSTDVCLSFQLTNCKLSRRCHANGRWERFIAIVCWWLSISMVFHGNMNCTPTFQQITTMTTTITTNQLPFGEYIFLELSVVARRVSVGTIHAFAPRDTFKFSLPNALRANTTLTSLNIDKLQNGTHLK